MRMQKSFFLSLFLFLFLSISAQHKKPRLVIGIVVDQMKPDYLYRYESLFGEEGFRRLMKDGFTFHNCQINYFPSYTGPGHASIYTGTTPSMHGIVGNDWYNRELKKSVNCVSDTTVFAVGGSKKSGQYSPKNLLASTIGDELRMSNHLQSKVIGISIKDRGAILPAGHTANAAYWYDGENGNFVSSTYYMDSLPAWVNTFNAEKHAVKLLEKPWELLYPADRYKYLSAEDDAPGEKPFQGETRPVFPHDLKGILNNSKTGLKLLAGTPGGNTIIASFAMETIKAEKLGEDEFTDLLCLSFSSTDYTGHQFGTSSLELADMYARLDKELEKLLRFLDKEIGKDAYTIFLTADHGAAHTPVYATEQRYPNKGINSKHIDSLKLLMPSGTTIEHYDNLQFYLKENHPEIQWNIEEFFSHIPGISYTIVSRDLLGADEKDPVLGRLKRGYYPKRCGDVFLVPDPGTIDMPQNAKGTTHGNVYNYDTRIPLLFYGAGIIKGKNTSQVSITDIAPTIAHLLRIPFPNAAIGKILFD